MITLPSVRPTQFASRSGHVAALNARDSEIGVTFGGERSHDVAVWFQPDEVAVVKAGQSLSVSRSGSASPSVVIRGAP